MLAGICINYFLTFHLIFFTCLAIQWADELLYPMQCSTRKKLNRLYWKVLHLDWLQKKNGRSGEQGMRILLPALRKKGWKYLLISGKKSRYLKRRKDCLLKKSLPLEMKDLGKVRQGWQNLFMRWGQAVSQAGGNPFKIQHYRFYR